MTDTLYEDAVALLRRLIATPSFSCKEGDTANMIAAFLQEKNAAPQFVQYNVWAHNTAYDSAKPTLLLHSHHDTVKPNKGYTKNPFEPLIEDGKLYGLGSNDAGASLVSLLAAFLYFKDKENLRYNFLFAAGAEEEISGGNGVELLLPALGKIDVAIVGEPTDMQMAIAEKGLLVLDCSVRGQAGHAARDEGENAIYKALPDIEWFRTFQFPKVSSLLGPVKMSVTIIAAGVQHNVVPDVCTFTVDVRVNELYSHEEILAIIRTHVSCDVQPRSMRLRATGIDVQHPLVQAGLALGKITFGSATMSDKALMPFPALKMGPGDSSRSHSADEFIYLRQIEEGITTYIQLLQSVL